MLWKNSVLVGTLRMATQFMPILLIAPLPNKGHQELLLEFMVIQHSQSTATRTADQWLKQLNSVPENE